MFHPSVSPFGTMVVNPKSSRRGKEQIRLKISWSGVEV